MKHIWTGIMTCAVLLTGCGKAEQSVPVAETTAISSIPATETESPVSITETADIASVPITEDETASAIGLTCRALDALHTRNTEEMIRYTNLDLVCYLDTGNDPEDTETLAKMIDEGLTTENFYHIFDGDFDIEYVKKDTALKDKFTAYIKENTDEETAKRMETYPIEDIIAVHGTMTYPDGDGDTGTLYLMKVEDTWKLDVCFSFAMEASGLWGEDNHESHN